MTKLVRENLTFADISLPPNLVGEFESLEDEEWREYDYDNMTIRIENPVALARSISSSGGHYVICRDGQVHYLPAGWLCLTWFPKEDAEFHMAW